MSNQVYRFDSDKMYPRDVSGFQPIDVVPLQVKCHNVKPGRTDLVGNGTWEFQVVGKDEWYVTSYAWALILDTPENLELVRLRNLLIADRKAVERKIKAQQAQILTVAAVENQS